METQELLHSHLNYNLYTLCSRVFTTFHTGLRNTKWTSFLRSLRSQHTRFWKPTRYFTKSQTTIPPLNYQGDIVYLSSLKAEALPQQFERSNQLTLHLGSQHHSAKVTRSVEHFFQTTTPHTPPLQLTNIYEPKCKISSLKIRSAPGDDEITSLMLRNLSRKALCHLSHLFNFILRLQHFPNSWKNANVIPIFKPNKPPSEPSSYRPIGLLSTLSKLFERVLTARLTSFVNQRHLLPNVQFGFRKKHSTVAQLARITDFITNGFNLHKHTGMILLDIENAYDTVWIHGLLFKLITVKFPTHFFSSKHSWKDEPSRYT